MKIPAGQPSPSSFVILATQLLRDGQAICFIARGQSMHPLIQDGDLITVRPVAHARIRPGAVILYIVGGKLIAHRVIRRRSKRYITRGDAYRGLCERVDAADVLGIVDERERNGDRDRIDRPWLRWSALIRAWGLAALWGAATAWHAVPRRLRRITSRQVEIPEQE